MTDLRKPSFDLLYELIEESNPGFTAKFPKGSIKFTAIVASTAGGGFTNTRITFRPTIGSTAIGSGYLYYRRLDFSKLFKNMTLSVATYRNATSIANTEFIPLVNQKYGLNLDLSDIVQTSWPADSASALQAVGTALCYVGSIAITWIKGKRPLSDLVTADKRTLDGRVFPSSISTYDQFLTAVVGFYGNNNQDTNKALAASATSAIAGTFYCAESGMPVIGDPVGDFVRYDSGMSGVVRMLMNDPAVANDNFANRRRIGILYEASTARQSFAAATRNGVTSEAAGAGTGNAIGSMLWWDEINRRVMFWQNPKTAGTKSMPYKSRLPLATERPRGDLIGYNGDYSKWASKLSGTISWQEVADAMKEITGLPFSMDDYSIPFGLGNIPGGNFPRYTLPTASVPEANSAKFNRVVLVTAPSLGAWWTGRFFLHYNI